MVASDSSAVTSLMMTSANGDMIPCTVILQNISRFIQHIMLYINVSLISVDFTVTCLDVMAKHIEGNWLVKNPSYTSISRYVLFQVHNYNNNNNNLLLVHHSVLAVNSCVTTE